MKSHVAVLSFPFASHPSVLLHLVEKLAPASPDVTYSFFSTAFANQKLRSRQETLEGLNNFKSYDVNDGTPEGYVFRGNPLEPIGFFIDATPGNFRKRMAEVVEQTGVKITCLLVDAFLGFSADLADELSIPWLSFWTSGHRPLSAHYYTDEITKAIASAGEGKSEDMSLGFLPGMEKIHVSDLPPDLFTGHLDQPFPKMLYNMARAMPRATAVVFNTFDGLDSVVENDLSSKFRKALTIGPTAVPPSPPLAEADTEDEFGCLKWLKERETASVVYISFGTMLCPPPHELLALAEAVEEKKVAYLWSFRGDPRNSGLDGFLERTKSVGKMVPWAPQLHVLAHSSTAVFVTHCGWSSLMESLVCGVPMICRPFFGDQKLNGKVVEDVWQIGVGVEGGAFTKDGMIKALSLVLWDGGENKMRGKINMFKQSALKAVSTDGSSSENFKILLGMVHNKGV